MAGFTKQRPGKRQGRPCPIAIQGSVLVGNADRPRELPQLPRAPQSRVQGTRATEEPFGCPHRRNGVSGRPGAQPAVLVLAGLSLVASKSATRCSVRWRCCWRRGAEEQLCVPELSLLLRRMPASCRMKSDSAPSTQRASVASRLPLPGSSPSSSAPDPAGAPASQARPSIGCLSGKRRRALLAVSAAALSTFGEAEAGTVAPDALRGWEECGCSRMQCSFLDNVRERACCCILLNLRGFATSRSSLQTDLGFLGGFLSKYR